MDKLRKILLITTIICVLALIVNYALLDYSSSGVIPLRDEKGNVINNEDGTQKIAVVSNTFYDKELQDKRGKYIILLLTISIFSYSFITYRLRKFK